MAFQLGGKIRKGEPTSQLFAMSGDELSSTDALAETRVQNIGENIGEFFQVMSCFIS